MLGLGSQEIMIIAGVLVLLFGGSKVAQLGKGMGEAFREFKGSMNGSTSEEKTALTPKATVQDIA